MANRLQAMTAELTNAMTEVATIDQTINALRVDYANSWMQAEDDAHKTRIEADIRGKLAREELKALERLQALDALAIEFQRSVSDMSVNLSPDERRQVADLSAIHANPADDLVALERELRSATLRGDRPAMMFFGSAAKTALRGGDVRPSDLRRSLTKYTAQVDDALRDPAAGPVMEAARALMEATTPKAARIRAARQARGESDGFRARGYRRTVRVPGTGNDDPTGYDA